MSGTRGEAKTSPVVSFYSFVFLVVLIDQVTKFFILSWLPLEHSVPLIPNIFHVTLIYNTGIAFGFFRRHENILIVLISISLLVLFFIGNRMCKDSKTEPLARWGLALILGGAIGNWVDRIRFNAVVDFLDFRVWPVFNFADTAITVGVCFYVLLFFKKQQG